MPYAQQPQVTSQLVEPTANHVSDTGCIRIVEPPDVAASADMTWSKRTSQLSSANPQDHEKE